MPFIAKETRTSEQGFCVVPARNIRFWEALRNGSVPKSWFTARLPKYRRFSEVYAAACEIVHGIEDLYKNVKPGNLRIYFGRSTKDTFLNNCGSQKRSAGYSGVVAFCETDHDCYKRHEKLAIAMVKAQTKLNALCVGGVLNKRIQSCGAEADGRPILYVAWKLAEYESYTGKPDATIRKNIIDILSEKSQSFESFPGRRALLRALQAANRATTKQHLYWPATWRDV